MDKRCKFKKGFSKKRLPNNFRTFLKISVDKYMAMWYDKGLGSVGADGFDFVKSLAVISNPC